MIIIANFPKITTPTFMVKLIIVAKKSKSINNSGKTFRSELVGQMLNLTTSGFGLVAALAWNSAITSLVQKNIQKFFFKDADSANTISLFIYAILITMLAVTITYQLSKLAAHLQSSKR